MPEPTEQGDPLDYWLLARFPRKVVAFFYAVVLVLVYIVVLAFAVFVVYWFFTWYIMQWWWWIGIAAVIALIVGREIYKNLIKTLPQREKKRDD